MRELTESQVVEEAKYHATPISDLIHPQEVDDGAESWDDVDSDTLRREIHKSVDIILSECNYAHPKISGLIHDYAKVLWRDDMSRAKMEHLAFDSHERAFEKGFWPNKADKWELYEWIDEQDHAPRWYHIDARETVAKGLHKGMKP